jgi:hypothetical protein
LCQQPHLQPIVGTQVEQHHRGRGVETGVLVERRAQVWKTRRQQRHRLDLILSIQRQASGLGEQVDQ